MYSLALLTLPVTEKKTDSKQNVLQITLIHLVAMPIRIEGQDFTGFFGPGFDANKLRALSHVGRVEWLRFRFNLIFAKPFNGLVALDNGDCYVWLCLVNLLCGAVEALAGFEFPGRNPMLRFSNFVEKYFRPDWKQPLNLHDLKPYRNAATKPAEHLYKYFRCGLEHSLAIEWGGIRHRGEGAPSYLFERKAAGDHNSLGVVPRELVDDFLTGVERFFQAASSWDTGVQERNQFNRRFEEVF